MTQNNNDTASDKQYKLYQPKVEQHYIYKEEPNSQYLFGHMASIEYFDGRFHAVWNNSHGAHCMRYYKEKGKKMPFQRLLWQTSPDAKVWSEPVRITEEMTKTPLDQWSDPHTHWQPNLINYKDKELWCIWSLGEGAYFDIEEEVDNTKSKALTGTYLSTLGKGPDARWVHRRIFGEVEVESQTSLVKKGKGYLFPSQNPVILESGRLIQPVTVVLGEEYNLGSLMDNKAYFSAVIYTDDDGESWEISNMVSNVDNALAQWEPHVMEQTDGKLRMFIRDTGASKGVHDVADIEYRTALYNPLFLTTTGTGTQKGEPIVFEPDAERVWIETEGSRMHMVILPCGRRCMFHHDVWNAFNKGTRSNLAMYFSRTGENDFVAGPGIVGRSNPAHYAQGIVHDGKLYVAYTRWNTSIRSGGSTADCEERGIAISIIDDLPEKNCYYIWPRDKDLFASQIKNWRDNTTNSVYVRPFAKQSDERNCIVFKECGTAGVEIEPVDFTKGEKLKLSFQFKILKAQTYGNLVLCSFGSRIPIRVGMPGNRPGILYAYGRNQWKSISSVDMDGWNSMEIQFGADEFSVQINEGKPVTCINPLRYPEKRLYLGEGYEIDQLESNRNSEFLIDIDTLHTEIF